MMGENNLTNRFIFLFIFLMFGLQADLKSCSRIDALNTFKSDNSLQTDLKS